jgi:hypothetical protein
MPNIRVMTWNIQDLSWTKMQINGMATAIARTVVAQNIDILVVVEVCKTDVASAMYHLAATLNAEAGGGHAYLPWFLSYETGTEHYAFFVKDLRMVRPLGFEPNPNIPPGQSVPDGTAENPLQNLQALRWRTWPDNDSWGHVPTPLPLTPRIPLVNTYALLPRDRTLSAKHFRGQSHQYGGHAEKIGARLPCMALFKVRTAGNEYILPIICCHYAAVRDKLEKNILAHSQVKHLPNLHIAQLYARLDPNRNANPNQNPNANPNPNQPPPLVSGYLDVDGAPTLVRNILFTGDFNIDFQVNSNAVGASELERLNYMAYRHLTPTPPGGGSAAPAAQPGNAPNGAAPGVPFAFPLAQASPTSDLLTQQQLRVAVTTDGTIFYGYDPNKNLAVMQNTQALRAATLDNFFYGGAQVRNTVGAFGTNGVDAGQVIDFAANVAQPGAALAAGQIDLSGPAAHHAARGTRNAALAPNLQANVNAGQPLSVIDRWIGAGLVSDHLPVVLEFVCP